MEESPLQENDAAFGKKLNILFITPRFPYPLIGGDRVKPFFILKHLAKRHNVTLVANSQGGPPAPEHIKAVENLGLEIFAPPFTAIKGALRAGQGALRSLPLEIGFYTHPHTQKLIDKLISERGFDLSVSFFMRSAEYVKNKNGFKKFLMAEDCRTLYQKRSSEESANLKQKIVRAWEYNKLKTYEAKTVARFDVTTFVTGEDIESMKQMNPSANYRLLSNGVDIDKFTPPENNAREGILFAGRLDIWANVLMVDKIVKKIMPLVNKEAPGAKLYIVGAAPPSEVMAHESDNIKIIANVPSMAPYLQKARVFIHPHSGGSGIQNKLLEAMACACPVVTTKTGIQGIPATHGKDLMIGRGAYELAKHTIDLLHDEKLASKIGENARQMIAETHSWQAIYDDMDGILKELFP